MPSGGTAARAARAAGSHGIPGVPWDPGLGSPRDLGLKDLGGFPCAQGPLGGGLMDPTPWGKKVMCFFISFLILGDKNMKNTISNIGRFPGGVMEIKIQRRRSLTRRPE